VRGQTPKVAKQDKKKKPRGRAHKRMQYNRRFVTAGQHTVSLFFPFVYVVFFLFNIYICVCVCVCVFISKLGIYLFVLICFGLGFLLGILFCCVHRCLILVIRIVYSLCCGTLCMFIFG
jgi:ribosomal protein S30